MKNKGQVFNPYLPLHEYIPDGEPHVLVTGSTFSDLMTERAELHFAS